MRNDAILSGDIRQGLVRIICRRRLVSVKESDCVLFAPLTEVANECGDEETDDYECYDNDDYDDDYISTFVVAYAPL